MNQEEQGKKMAQLIAKCWADEGFKRKLLADAAGTLKAEGVELPAGLLVKAMENTDKVFHLVIPAKPTDLSDADLDMVSAGASRTGYVPGRFLVEINGIHGGFVKSVDEEEQGKKKI